MKKIKRHGFALLSSIVFAAYMVVTLGQQAFAEDKTMKINLTIDNNKTITALLEDNIAARDFMALLPLTLELRDFAGTEKASHALPKKLNTKGLPSGHKPATGDLTYYAPWGNLAIFYHDDNYADGLIYLGRYDDLSAFNKLGDVRVTITANQE